MHIITANGIKGYDPKHVDQFKVFVAAVQLEVKRCNVKRETMFAVHFLTSRWQNAR